MLTIHLPEDLEAFLLAEAESGRFASVDDAIALAYAGSSSRRPPRGRSLKKSCTNTCLKSA